MASPSALVESLKTTLTDRALELVNTGGELTLVIRAADLLHVAAELRDQPQPHAVAPASVESVT